MTKSALPPGSNWRNSFRHSFARAAAGRQIRYRSGIPIICASRSDCRTTSCQATSKGSASNFGLLTQSTRLDPWATTEIIRVGNAQQLRQHAGIVDICVYEIQLPGIAAPKG